MLRSGAHAGDFCPHCGARYDRRRRRLSRRARWALGGALLALVLGGAGAGVALKLHHDDQVKQRRADAAKRAAAKRQAAIDAANQRAAQDRLERAERSVLIRAMERSIAKDAQKRVDQGILDGPVLRAECNPTAETDPNDLSADTGEFECLAVTKENADGTASGYRFMATANYADSSYTWHLGG